MLHTSVEIPNEDTDRHILTAPQLWAAHIRPIEDERGRVYVPVLSFTRGAVDYELDIGSLSRANEREIAAALQLNAQQTANGLVAVEGLEQKASLEPQKTPKNQRQVTPRLSRRAGYRLLSQETGQTGAAVAPARNAVFSSSINRPVIRAIPAIVPSQPAVRPTSISARKYTVLFLTEAQEKEVHKAEAHRKPGTKKNKILAMDAHRPSPKGRGYRLLTCELDLAA